MPICLGNLILVVGVSQRRPDGLGFLWQQRWFVLTRTKLCYFKSQVDTRAHAQLGQIPLKQIISVQSDPDSTGTLALENATGYNILCRAYTVAYICSTVQNLWSSLPTPSGHLIH
jgi:hypothetical protein